MISNNYNFSLNKPKLIFSRILFLMIISSCNGCDEKQASSIPRFDDVKDNIKNLSIPKENQNSIKKQIIEQPGLYMILLYRNKCEYCKAFVPKFKNLSNEYKEYNITFGGVSFSDEDRKRSQQKKLMNIRPKVMWRCFRRYSLIMLPVPMVIIFFISFFS